MATALADADPRCPGVSRARPARVLLAALQSQRYEEHRALVETTVQGRPGFRSACSGRKDNHG